MFFKNKMGPIDAIIVGLGNPGAKYTITRHNVGFNAIDHIADKLSVSINKLKFEGLYAQAKIGEARVLLLKPQTYMNLSGDAVGEAAAFYHVEPDHVIVICDDVTLDVGRLRVRGKGSDGGHNGMKSIIAQLGSNEFARVRIGVGKKPHPSYDLADWVLSAFSAEELATLNGLNEAIEKGVSLLLKGDLAAAMQVCNGVGGSC